MTVVDSIRISDEASVVALARDLGAPRYGGPLSRAEIGLLKLADKRARSDHSMLKQLRENIIGGGDPLGEAFCALRSPLLRRDTGTFYTPPSIVRPMVSWVLNGSPFRVIDAGCGSGRFAQQTLLQSPKTRVIAIDLDPIATLMTRVVFAVLNSKKSMAINADYTTLSLDKIRGRTGYVGNPPYVRHHDLTVAAKRRAAKMAADLGHRISGLAGLHAHFILATAFRASKGDIGAFVTSAEWLDTNYGGVVRDLMLNGLGGRGVHMFAAESIPFADAMATAAISYFEIGSKPEELQFAKSTLHSIESGLGSVGHTIPKAILAGTNRWSPMLEATSNLLIMTCKEHSRIAGPTLGSIARVHRGQVTGANDFFVLSRARARELGIDEFCRPVITRAQEILTSGGLLHDSPNRAVLLEVPPDIKRTQYPRLNAYLKLGEKSIDGEPPICDRWIPSHRRPWFSVKAPRPSIIATYMARQAPMFATNPDRLALLNVGHGIFPNSEFSEEQVNRLVAALNFRRNDFVGMGRTYHGGLEKFEPGEMENLPLPEEVAVTLAR